MLVRTKHAFSLHCSDVFSFSGSRNLNYASALSLIPLIISEVSPESGTFSLLSSLRMNALCGSLPSAADQSSSLQTHALQWDSDGGFLATQLSFDSAPWQVIPGENDRIIASHRRGGLKWHLISLLNFSAIKQAWVIIVGLMLQINCIYWPEK